VDADLLSAEVRREIGGSLDRVPSQQRVAFVLREVQEMGSAGICKILEVSRTNLGVMLHRVRNRLRECLEAKGFKGANECSIAGKRCESQPATD
jgi:DNA-directed RNA polymerase specialized sigma24 family protein